MNVGVVIQARMGSTRLPGKILKDLCGSPMLAHVIRRVKAAERIDVVCVATTDMDIDDQVAQLAGECGAEVFRGSEDDVLSRYAGAAETFKIDLIVRVTSDCPMYDAALLDEMLESREELVKEIGTVDYYSNCIQRTFPRGLDTEIVPLETLQIAHREAVSKSDREHVLPYIYDNPDRFRLGHYVNPDGDQSSFRWTVDTPEDYEMVQHVYEELYPVNPLFDRKMILALLAKRPELKALNAHIEQKKA